MREKGALKAVVVVFRLVYKNLKTLCKARKPEDMIFSIDPSKVNDYFKQFMQELSAKVTPCVSPVAMFCVRFSVRIMPRSHWSRSCVCRRGFDPGTCHFSFLGKFDPEEHDISDPSEMVKFYNDANRRVAILCNHQVGIASLRSAVFFLFQRAPPKQHEAGMERLKKKLADQEVDKHLVIRSSDWCYQATLRGLEGRRDELLGKTVSKDVRV